MTATPPTRPTLLDAKRALLELGGGARKGSVNLRFESAPAGSGVARTVARLEIDHPEARSAISLSMMCDLADAVYQLQQWTGALVIVSSTDRRAFCSGGHLGEIPQAIGPGPGAANMARAMTAVLDALLDLPQITVSAIDGVAIGGGAELATATDFRVAGPEARIHFVHARLGIAPGWGGTGRLARIIGRGPALRILSRARPLLPGEAVQLGLVDHRCDGHAVEGALAWVGDVLSVEPEALRAIKRQIVAMNPVRPPGSDPDAEVAAFADVWGGPAHRAALAATWGPTVEPAPER